MSRTPETALLPSEEYVELLVASMAPHHSGDVHEARRIAGAVLDALRPHLSAAYEDGWRDAMEQDNPPESECGCGP